MRSALLFLINIYHVRKQKKKVDEKFFVYEENGKGKTCLYFNDTFNGTCNQRIHFQITHVGKSKITSIFITYRYTR